MSEEYLKERLYWALRSSKTKKKQLNWHHAMYMACTGASHGYQLCVDLGVDPEGTDFVKAESKEGEMLLTTDEVELIKTCDESPEQYIAVFQGQQIGYLRLRHGEFRVDYPDCGDETIFYTQEPQGDGCFEDDEREHFLMKAKEAIVKKFNEMEG